jgi:uncharacterized protein (TIGR03643 family)
MNSSIQTPNLLVNTFSQQHQQLGFVLKTASLAPLAARPSTYHQLSTAEQSRVIEMAWEDRTPFEAIAFQFGLSEAKVIELMRSQLKASSFRMWRKRVTGRTTKHLKIRPAGMAQDARHTAQLNVARQK